MSADITLVARVIRYLLSRLVTVPLLLLGASLVIFLVLRLSPGEPATRILNANGEVPTDPAAVAQLRHQWQLDQSLPVQYGHWLRLMVRGDFGRSFASGQSVNALIAVRLPATLALTVSALALALLVAIPFGIMTALSTGTPLDAIGRIVALVGLSLPGYWLGLLLVWLIAVRLHWLPAIGRGGIAHLVLPAITLATGLAATQVRLIRASLIETLGESYVRVARAKGLSELHVVVRHALRNALVAPLTALGIGIGHLLGGAVVVETVFAYPGFGKLTVDAISTRDYPVIQAFVVLMTALFVLSSLIVDLLYALLDPRVRVGTVAA